jgi:hypothetical protein
MIQRLFISFIFLLFVRVSFAQVNNEKYCELEIYQVTSKFLHTSISFGNQDKDIADSAAGRNEIISYLKKIKTKIDAINFMSSKGWNLISSCVVNGNGNPFFYFYFKSTTLSLTN